MDRKLKPIVIALALATVLGAAAIGYAIHLKQERALFFQKYDRTFGRVLEYKQDSLGRDYPVVIFISEDSQRVHIPLPGYSSSEYEIGDPVPVYYDLINPTDAGVIRSQAFQVWFLGLSGVAILLLAWGWGGYTTYQLYQRRRLRQHGRRIRAKVQSVSHDPQIRINGNPAYVIHCQWQKSDHSGTYYTFQSEPLPEDPSPQLGKELDVYIDLKNPKKYWVDTSFL